MGTMLPRRKGYLCPIKNSLCATSYEVLFMLLVLRNINIKFLKNDIVCFKTLKIIPIVKLV